MFDLSLDEKIESEIENYISYLVNNNVCEGMYSLVEIKLIYIILNKKVPSELNEAISRMTTDLYINGGFSPVPTNRVGDVILTAKIYRVLNNDRAGELLDFLSDYIVDKYLAPNSDITQTDLRFYYNYYKLWLIYKGV